jgi:hypothetical protein
MKKGLNCYEDNIAPVFKNLLRPALQDSLLKLQDMFNKDR